MRPLAGGAFAHGLVARGAVGGIRIGRRGLFTRRTTLLVHPLAEAPLLEEGFTELARLRFEHRHRAHNQDQQGVGDHRRVLVIEPASKRLPFLVEVDPIGMQGVVGMLKLAQAQTGQSLPLGIVTAPRDHTTIGEEHLEVAQQLAQTSTRHIGQLDLGLSTGAGPLRAFDDVLPPRARGPHHLPDGLAQRILPVGDEPLAEPAGLQVNHRRECKGMQPAVAAMLDDKWLAHDRSPPGMTQ